MHPALAIPSTARARRFVRNAAWLTLILFPFLDGADPRDHAAGSPSPRPCSSRRCSVGLHRRRRHPSPAPLRPATRRSRPAFVQTAAGERLALKNWPARNGAPRAVILALHGFGDSGEETFARRRRLLGRARHPHLRPRSARLRRQRLVQALARPRRAHRAMRSPYPVRCARPIPACRIVVVGESMGGGVALAAAAARPRGRRLVLSGPAIAGGEVVSPVVRAGGWALASTLPDRRWTGGGVVRIRPTDNRGRPDRARAATPTPTAAPRAGSSTACCGSWTAPPPQHPTSARRPSR
jgi:pimeloyl-ACP methyl ester carboxylesterase